MGFLDRVKGTVANAKDGLDRSGLLDQAKNALQTSTSSAPGGEPALAVDRTQDMIDSIRRGAVDPSSLLDAAEVSAIASAQVGPAEIHFNGDFVYVSFDTTELKHREQYQLSVCHAMDDEVPWDANEHWDHVTENLGLDNVTRLRGLGDDAFRLDGYVWAKASGRVLFGEVVGERLDDATKAARSEQLVRAAVAKL